ncbi:MAG: hypothetical protein K6T16_00800 [Candidatus Pacearchaeota archaeon]|nr:hypothetical protein [Candidatus Pacearchaeota archaeon]
MRCKTRRKRLFFVSFILIALILCVFWNILYSSNAEAAECIALKLAKTEYLPKETAQVEIDANVMRDVLASDIFLYRGTTLLPTTFFTSKVTDTKFFLWFDLAPEPGEYSLRVRGYCKDGNLYVANIPIPVRKSVGAMYDSLRTKVEGKWRMLSLEEHILSAGALSYVLHRDSLDEFRNRSDSCIHKECNTKLNALTLISFKDSVIRQQMQDALEASQNYVKGNWKLKIYSVEPQKCNLTLNETITLDIDEGENSFDLSLNPSAEPEIKVALGCEESVSAKIVNSYGKYNRTFERAGRTLQFLINNKGCWGAGIRTECNNDATAYTLLSLAIADAIDLNGSHAAAVDWLRSNAATVEDRIIIYYITRNASLLTEILNLQMPEGWWPRDTRNYEPSIGATSLAIFALKDSDNGAAHVAVERARRWLRDKSASGLSLRDEAFVLSFAFGDKNIEPILALWPGLVKVDSGKQFDLILVNNGPLETNVSATLMNSTALVALPVNGIKRVQFNVPLVTTTDGRTISETLALSYRTKISDASYSYAVPVLIFTRKSIEESVEGEINASEQEINESEQKEIINKTEELKNKTANITESLIKKRFRFIEKNITKKVNLADGPFVVALTIENKLDEDVEDVLITRSSSLIGVLDRVEPSFIDVIPKGHFEEITLYFAPTMPRGYSGEINATATYRGEKVAITIPVVINVSGTAAELKNCSEMGGKICKDEDNMVCDPTKGNKTDAGDTYACCIPADACKRKQETGRLIGVIIVIVIVLILIGVLFFLKKKSRKEMTEFLEEASKSYERKFQRPAMLKKEM